MIPVVASALFMLGVGFCVLPADIDVSIEGNVYENRPLTENRVSVRVMSAAGIELPYAENSTEIEIGEEEGKAKVSAKCGVIVGEEEKEIIPIDKINVEYYSKAYPGDRFDKNKLHVSTVFADGLKEETGNYSITASPERFTKEDAKICVKTADGTGELDLKPVGIHSVDVEVKDKIYQYDTLKVSNIVVSYEDGWKMLLDEDDVEFSIGKDEPLEKLGEQTISFSYEGVSYDFNVTTLENTKVSNAVRKYADEIDGAEHTYISDNCFITVTKHVDSMGTYYLSHVVVNDPSQIHADLSYGDWGGKREKPSNAVNRLGLVLATNASYFSYDTGNPRCTDVIIKNGEIMSDGETDGKEICLKKDGTLFTPEEGLTGKDLIEMDVEESWAAGDPLLIQNGNLYPTHHDWVNGKYPRTGVGMIEPCEYYVLTAGSGGYKGGLTFDDVQDIFKDLGCQYARTLDGGGSSTLAVDCDGEGAELVNNPAGGSERAVVDIFGVSDLPS